MRKLALAALLAALAAAAGAAEGSALVARLRASAAAGRRFVRLAEVAELSGRDAARAGKVLLGPAPGPGARRPISREEIALRLEEEGFDRRSFRVEGAGEVVVRPASEKRPAPAPAGPDAAAGADLRARAAGWVRRALAERLSCRPESLTVRASRVRGALPAGELTPRVQWPAGRVRLGNMRVGIDLFRDGRAVGRLEASVEAAGRMKVLVAARDLGRNEPINPADVRSAELSLTDLGAQYLCDERKLEGACAARPIRAGWPLEARLVKRRPLVSRGQAVSLVSEVGSVTASELAVARGEGGRGDVVAVEVLRGGKRVQLAARVTGSGIVKME